MLRTVASRTVELKVIYILGGIVWSAAHLMPIESIPDVDEFGLLTIFDCLHDRAVESAIGIVQPLLPALVDVVAASGVPADRPEPRVANDHDAGPRGRHVDLGEKVLEVLLDLGQEALRLRYGALTI